MSKDVALHRAAFRRLRYHTDLAYHHFKRSGRSAYYARLTQLLAASDALYDLCEWR